MSRAVRIGDLTIGAGNRIAVQSMLNCDTLNFDAVVEQILALESEKCDIIRIAIEDIECVEIAKKYLRLAKVPLVADIHFDYKLAVACADIGFPKIRINPSNIEQKSKNCNALNEVALACKRNKTAIRVGVNAGSLESDLLKSHGICAKSLNLSALRAVERLNNLGIEDLVVSIKASDVKTTIEANRLLATNCDFPLHIGVTESGGLNDGTIKSAIGVGALLCDNIGDTIRTSLTASPVEEVRLARQILKAINKLEHCEVISCPTCSRCKYNVHEISEELRNFVKNFDKGMKIAVMGCAVNGPGEAREADIGVAGAGKKAVIFKKGEIIKTVDHQEVVSQMKLMIIDELNHR